MSKNNHDDDIAFIRALAEVLQDNDLGEIEVERERGGDNALKVRLTRCRKPPAAWRPRWFRRFPKLRNPMTTLFTVRTEHP